MNKYLNIKRLEELVDRRQTIMPNYVMKPRALRSTLLLIQTHKLGVIVVNLTLTHRNYRTNARLLVRVVVQAHLAEGGHAHLGFKSGSLLRPWTPIDGSGHLTHDVFDVLEICAHPNWSHKGCC